MASENRELSRNAPISGNSAGMFGANSMNSGPVPDLHLIAAILHRRPAKVIISLLRGPSSRFASTRQELNREITLKDLDLMKRYDGLVSRPLFFALKLYDEQLRFGTIEVTDGNQPTRADVVFTLAQNFALLREAARQFGFTPPNIEEAIKYAEHLDQRRPPNEFHTESLADFLHMAFSTTPDQEHSSFATHSL